MDLVKRNHNNNNSNLPFVISENAEPIPDIYEPIADITCNIIQSSNGSMLVAPVSLNCLNGKNNKSFLTNTTSCSVKQEVLSTATTSCSIKQEVFSTATSSCSVKKEVLPTTEKVKSDEIIWSKMCFNQKRRRSVDYSKLFDNGRFERKNNNNNTSCKTSSERKDRHLLADKLNMKIKTIKTENTSYDLKEAYSFKKSSVSSSHKNHEEFKQKLCFNDTKFSSDVNVDYTKYLSFDNLHLKKESSVIDSKTFLTKHNSSLRRNDSINRTLKCLEQSISLHTKKEVSSQKFGKSFKIEDEKKCVPDYSFDNIKIKKEKLTPVKNSIENGSESFRVKTALEIKAEVQDEVPKPKAHKTSTSCKSKSSKMDVIILSSDEEENSESDISNNVEELSNKAVNKDNTKPGNLKRKTIDKSEKNCGRTNTLSVKVDPKIVKDNTKVENLKRKPIDKSEKNEPSNCGRTNPPGVKVDPKIVKQIKAYKFLEKMKKLAKGDTKLNSMIDEDTVATRLMTSSKRSTRPKKILLDHVDSQTESEAEEDLHREFYNPVYETRSQKRDMIKKLCTDDTHFSPVVKLKCAKSMVSKKSKLDSPKSCTEKTTQQTKVEKNGQVKKVSNSVKRIRNASDFLCDDNPSSEITVEREKKKKCQVVEQRSETSSRHQVVREERFEKVKKLHQLLTSQKSEKVSEHKKSEDFLNSKKVKYKSHTQQRTSLHYSTNEETIPKSKSKNEGSSSSQYSTTQSQDNKNQNITLSINYNSVTPTILPPAINVSIHNHNTTSHIYTFENNHTSTSTPSSPSSNKSFKSSCFNPWDTTTDDVDLDDVFSQSLDSNASKTLATSSFSTGFSKVRPVKSRGSFSLEGRTKQ